MCSRRNIPAKKTLHGYHLQLITKAPGTIKLSHVYRKLKIARGMELVKKMYMTEQDVYSLIFFHRTIKIPVEIFRQII